MAARPRTAPDRQIPRRDPIPAGGPALGTERLRRLSGRERWLIRAVLAATAALAVVVVVAVATAGHSTGGRCIDFTVPYSVGGQEFFQCGTRARTTCRSVGQPRGFQGPAAAVVATQCRKVGFAVGRAG
jgi:hypothetical protein